MKVVPDRGPPETKMVGRVGRALPDGASARRSFNCCKNASFWVEGLNTPMRPVLFEIFTGWNFLR